MKRRMICHLLAVAFCISVVVPLAWMTFYRVPPIVVVNPRIEPQAAKPGDTVRVVWFARRERNGCGGAVRRRVVDSADVTTEYAEVGSVYHDSVSGIYSREFRLPYSMAYGPAWHQAIRVYWCNPIQEHLWPIVIVGVRIPFKVRP